MSTTPSVLCKVELERFDKGMDSPVFDVSLNEEASTRKGNAKRTRMVGGYMLARCESRGPQPEKRRLEATKIYSLVPPTVELLDRIGIGA